MTTTETDTGKAISLAEWFGKPTNPDGPARSFTRAVVLDELHGFTAYGVAGGTVAVKTPHGRALLEAGAGGRAVCVDYTPDGGRARSRFDIDAAAAATLGRKLRAARGRRVPFAALCLS